MSPEQAFGQVILQKRREKNLSQVDLAVASDLDRTFISRLENGHRAPGLETILQLAYGLEISSAELMIEVERALAT